MSVKLVTYDLNKESKRPPLLKDIKELGDVAQLSESSYAVDNQMSPADIFKRLEKHLDGNDSCYVITLAAPYHGLGPDDVNEWLRTRL